MASNWKNQRIQDHFVVLCNELNVDRIVPVLRAEHMLTTDEFEQLTNPTFTTQSRRQKLLLFIPRKGRAHFEKFAECLVWSGQSELARKIGVPVEDIRPSPHPSVQQSPTSLQQDEFRRMMIHVLADGMGRLPYPMDMAPPPPYPASHHSTAAPQHNPPPPSLSRPVQAAEPQGYSRPVQATETTTSSSPQFIQHRPTAGAVRPSPPLPREPDPEPVGDVLILYCSDQEMGGEDFSESVVALADFLTRVCGERTHIHCDFYLTHPPSNWTRWTERQIRECGRVLLVCSKTLKQMLDHRNPDRPVPMKKGHFNAETVYNLIRSPKFIPVFVNHTGLDSPPDLYSQPYRDWVPSQLLGVSRYWLDLEGLHREVRETSTEKEYMEELARVLGKTPPAKSVEPMTILLRVLQGVADTERPAPFPEPIIPPAPAHLPPELTFTDHELMTVASCIPRDWQTLGIKLGLIYSRLELIRYKHNFDVQQAAMEMLDVWRREKGQQATRTALKEALVAVHYGRLAEEVFGRD